jgi:hypothetical protein
MATYAQTPGLLNIKGVVGAHFSCQLDFGTSLSGYSFDAAIVLQEYPTKREQAVTVTIDNAGSGIITLSLTGAQTTAIGAIANKKWYLNWTTGGIKQTILAGRFELSDIPLGQNEVTSTGVTINTQSVDITLSAFSNAALDGKLDKSSVSAFGLTLIDDANAPAARTTLGLGTISTQNANNVAITGGSVTGITDITLADGGTGASLTGVAGGIVYSKASEFAITSVGSSGQVLTSAGSGQPIWTDPSSLSLTSASNVNVVDDNSTNAPYYPIFVPATGNTQPVTASSTKLNYNPSTGTLSATAFSGNLTGNVTGNLTGNVTGNLTGNITGSATSAVINNNDTANREFFPVFAYQSAGTATTLYGSSQKLKFNPSNGYFYSDGGFATYGGDLELKTSGVYWTGNLIFSAEENQINDLNGNRVAYWSGGAGMYVTGTASKDLPLRLMDVDAANLSTGAYIIVRPSASATTNGTELRNAYAAAKAFTPNTSALSATNRATVILLPGRYDLGTTRLNLDTDFVDIIGLTDTPEQVVITSSIVLSDSGTIHQTANDVKIKGVTIDRTGTPAGSGAGRTAAYFPFPKATAITSWSGNGATMTIAANGHGLQNGDSVRITGSGNSSVDGVFTVTRIDDNSFSYPSTVNAAGSIGTATERFNLTQIENCVFSGTSDSAMRRSTEYAGTYKKCVSGNESFQVFASGVFEDCVAGNNSFTTQASGTFTRCTAGTLSFDGNATGTFTDCTCVSGFASGSGHSASGIFTRCVVTGGAGFGSAGAATATGTFTDCSITHSTSYSGTFTGTMRRCRFVRTGTNNTALTVGNGAKIFDSTLIATGTGNSITAGSAVTISLAGCRMNKSINSNVSNNLGTLTESYNLIDEDIT